MDSTLVERLTSPASFDHAVTQLQVIETHVSWVILTGPYAYKIKKPVNFGFLDFSTLEKRLFCCEEELRLNNRTSEGLYLAVVPITEQGDALRVGGAGNVVDYAVKMRQFNPQETLAELLTVSEVSLDAFEKIGYRIAGFHRAAAVAESESGWGSLDAVFAPVEENFRQISERIDAAENVQVQKLAAAETDGFHALTPMLLARRKNGFIRELHGDLHAGNIARIDGQYVLFDCIEFNPNLRWIDTASDIAFLVMDLTYRGFQSQAHRFLNAYLEYTGDYDLLTVLDFYQSYRAMVRAKVAVLRLQQCVQEDDRQKLRQEYHGYLDFCANLQATSKPFMVMMMGVSGSGKSTLAKQVGDASGAIHIRSDAVRKRLFGMTPDAESPQAMRAELYSSEASRRTFAEMHRIAGQMLTQRRAVIVDATFIRQHTRLPFIRLAQAQGVPFVILHCSAPEAVLAERIEARAKRGSDPSEADVRVMRQQLADVELPEESEAGHVINAADAGWLQTLHDQLGW